MMSADYQVFICHRGPDVKRTVVNVLYNLLQSKGIKSFVDYDMLEGVVVKNSILEAIRMSYVHIVFLSPTFASSSWCLDELVEIMRIHKSKSDTSITHCGPLVLPVFCDVEPSEVRYQKKGSLYELKVKIERSTPQQRKQWSEALYDISVIKGIEYNSETMLLTEKLMEIVSRVDEFLKDMFPLVNKSEWKNFEGQIEETVNDLKSNDVKCKDVVSIGIRGPNNSEFADLLVDKIRKDYDARCILHSVMDKASDSGGVSVLTQKLYSDLIQEVNEQPIGRNAYFEHRLQNKRCLIVLNDIGNDAEQIKPLLDILKLKNNSLVVYTSRFQYILREVVKVDKFISLSASEENKGLLILSYSLRDDVHPAFIGQLQETFYTRGLDVCLLREEELLTDNKSLSKAHVIIRIISKNSRLSYLESNPVMTETDQPKVVYISYGPPCSSFSSTRFSLSVNFEASTGQLDNGEFKSMVEEVLEMWKKSNEKILHVSDFPVGLLQRDMEIKSRIMSYMSRSNSSVQCFGLTGMGGIGKTTAAKVMYNKMHMEFECSAFVLRIREEAAASGLKAIQKRILDNVMSKKFKNETIHDEEHGKALLNSKLVGIKAFIVLDDLDSKTQVDALYNPLRCLGANSIVIITSRDREILEYASSREIFEMELLSEKDSESLFNWHAFHKPVASAHLAQVSRKVIEACQGLPLALEELGSSLYNKRNVRLWEESLDFLEQNEKITSVLGANLNSLPSKQKEAFLDICCFLLGRTEEVVCAVLEGCYGMGETILTALTNKCLIRIEGEERTIRTHDPLRDMGRHISRKVSKYRAWDGKAANEALKDASVLSGLWGLSVDTEIKISEDVARYQALAQLGILLISEEPQDMLMSDGSLRQFFANVRCEGLRWLQWRSARFEEVPRGLCCTQLRVLDLSFTTIRRLPAPLPDLQILVLMECQSFEGFSTEIGCSMPCLRRLNLWRCNKLQTLDSSIGKLTDLRYLNLSFCAISCIPEELTSALSLRELILDFCRSLTTLPSLPTRLETLSLDFCFSLTTLPSLPKNLKRLSLDHCIKLESVDVIASLSNLRQLSLLFRPRSNSFEAVEAQSIRSLSCLRELRLERDSAKTLSDLPTNLQKLTCKFWDGPESLDASLPNVEELHLWSRPKTCPPFEEILKVDFDHIKASMLDDVESTNMFSSFLKDAWSLYMEIWTFEDRRFPTKTISHLPTNLRRLTLNIWESLESVDASLPRLEELHLWCCPKLKKLPILSSLVKLDIYRCDGLELLEPTNQASIFKGLSCLRELCLRCCASLESVSFLPTNLQELSLQYCKNLKLLNVATLTNLRLKVRGCPLLSFPEEINRLPSVKVDLEEEDPLEKAMVELHEEMLG